MFKLWHKIAQDARLIGVLIASNGVLLLIILLLWIGWMRAPSQLEIQQIPALESIVTMRSGEVSAPNVYSFSFYVWQVMNNWPKNGAVDFKQNLQKFSQYLTPRFKRQLETQYQEMYQRGELQGRIQILRGMPGDAFDQQNVLKIKGGAWQVNLVVRITDSIDGVIFKDTKIIYPLRVVRYDTNRQYNPWGLALDGFIAPPERLEDYTITS